MLFGCKFFTDYGHYSFFFVYVCQYTYVYMLFNLFYLFYILLLPFSSFSLSFYFRFILNYYPNNKSLLHKITQKFPMMNNTIRSLKMITIVNSIFFALILCYIKWYFAHNLTHFWSLLLTFCYLYACWYVHFINKSQNWQLKFLRIYAHKRNITISFRVFICEYFWWTIFFLFKCFQLDLIFK